MKFQICKKKKKIENKLKRDFVEECEMKIDIFFEILIDGILLMENQGFLWELDKNRIGIY